MGETSTHNFQLLTISAAYIDHIKRSSSVESIIDPTLMMSDTMHTESMSSWCRRVTVLSHSRCWHHERNIYASFFRLLATNMVSPLWYIGCRRTRICCLLGSLPSSRRFIACRKSSYCSSTFSGLCPLRTSSLIPPMGSTGTRLIFLRNSDIVPVSSSR